MSQINEQMIRQVVQEVVSLVQNGWGGRVAPRVGSGASPTITPAGATSGAARFGQFTSVDEAVAAASAAQKQIMRRSLAQRQIACDLIKRICIERADELGRLEYEETRLGHPAHKPEKLVVAGKSAMGTEALRTACFSGDYGITLDEAGPFGVVGVVTPVTHSLPTMAVNAVNMIAGGNAIVCNPHPRGAKIAALGAKLFNQAIYEKLGIDNLISVIVEPTLETANAIFGHKGIAILSITGGPGVVKAALKSGKRAVCAGPGNPPVVVDASADLDNAARCIIQSGSYDNNLLCLSEKEVFVVAEVYDAMMAAMERAGAYRLTAEQMKQLNAIVIDPAKDGGLPHANKDFVGAEPCVIAEAIGLRVPAECRLLFGPAQFADPLVQAEQMMPLMPFVRAENFEQAVDMAVQAEHGFGHTGIIHSRLVDHMTYMGKMMNTTLYVKNGPATAGNGGGGEGYSSYSIACSTGEGITTPMTFTRFRRCAMVDNLRIV